jgi:hypothetical protein
MALVPRTKASVISAADASAAGVTCLASNAAAARGKQAKALCRLPNTPITLL